MIVYNMALYICDKYQHNIMRWSTYLLFLFINHFKALSFYNYLSYDVASGSDITPCIKIDKPLVVRRFSNVKLRRPL